MSSGKSRAAWTLADQVLSSLTNFVLAVVVAKNVDPAAFGAFSLAILTYGFVVGLVRCFVGQPFIVRYSAEDAQRHDATRRAAGAALSIGTVAGLACILAALVLHGASGSALAAVGICLPGAILQDTWRHIFFAAGRPALATLNDGIWAVMQTLLLYLTLHAHSDVFMVTLAWGAAAAVAGLAGIVQARALPSMTGTRSWLHETRSMNARLGLGYVINMGCFQLAFYIVGGILGLTAVASLRAAQVLLGPLQLVFSAFNSYALPVQSRQVAAGRRLPRFSAGGSALLGAVAFGWVGVLLLVPDHLGRAVMGQNWDGADAVMLPSGVLLIVGALVLGASNGLIAMERSDAMLRVTIVQAPLFLLAATGAAWYGVAGAAWGFAVAQSIGLVMTWVVFLRLARRTPRHRAANGGGAAVSAAAPQSPPERGVPVRGPEETRSD